MTRSPESRNVAVWLLLVAVTLLSWESSGMSLDRRTVAALVLLLAFFKVRLIGIEFMELRSAPLSLRLGFEAWVVGTAGVLLALSWRAAA